MFGDSQASGSAANPPVFPEHGIEQSLRISERCEPQSFCRLREVDKSRLRGEFKQAWCAGDAQSQIPRNPDASALVDQNQVGIQGDSQGDHCCFTLIKRGWPGPRRFHDLQPIRRVPNPGTHRRGSAGIAEFFFHSRRKDSPLKEPGKQIDLADQNQVIYGSGIGNDQLQEPMPPSML